jgi:FXSXX-COOH protein
MSRRSSRRVWIVEKVASAIRLGSVEAIPVADVCDVPLSQLAGDADCVQMVRRVMRTQENPARVDVAAFNSAI